MIDWERVRTLKDEVGAEDFDEVLDLFFSEVEEVIGQLPDTADAKTVEQNMHFLKGAALNIGFSDLSQHCHDGEIAARENSDSQMNYGPVAQVYSASKTKFMADLPQMDTL